MVAYLDQTGVQHLIAKIRDVLWPVGTILATSTNTSPASYIGGSWESYAPGRTLVGITDETGFDALEMTGGKVNWDLGMDTDAAAAIRVDANGNFQVEWNGGYHSSATVKTGLAADTHASINWNYSSTGGGTKVVGTISAMQPYVVVSYWRRTA